MHTDPARGQADRVRNAEALSANKAALSMSIINNPHDPDARELLWQERHRLLREKDALL